MKVDKTKKKLDFEKKKFKKMTKPSFLHRYFTVELTYFVEKK